MLIFFIFGLNGDHLKDWSTLLGAGCCKGCWVESSTSKSGKVEMSTLKNKIQNECPFVVVFVVVVVVVLLFVLMGVLFG